MWVLLVLGGVVLVFARSMQVEAVASANRLGNVKAAAIEHAAEQFVLCQVDGTTGDAVSVTSIPSQAVQVGDGYFWLIRANPADDKNYDFGIVDEASKININSAKDTVLVNVPNSSQEIADSIIDWRDADETTTGQGGESSFYESLPEPYDAKNAPFETVEELLLVKNTGNGGQTISKDILFGSDLNRDGVIDTGETKANGSTGGASMAFSNGGGFNDSRGMYNFLTCYSIEPNTDASGKQRININDPNSRSALQKLLAQTLSTSRVSQVLEKVAGGGNRRQFPSIVAWYQATGMTTQEFGPIAGSITTSAAKTLTGMVNVNTASKQVLMCLPGVQESDAESIVSSRPANSGGISGAGGTGLTTSSNSSNSSTSVGDMTWLFQAVSPQIAASISPYITTRSFQYSADIVAVSGDGRSFRRVRIVVDARTSPAAIVYRKDLTGYGWPLPADLRTNMRRGSQPTIIQSTEFSRAMNVHLKWKKGADDGHSDRGSQRNVLNIVKPSRNKSRRRMLGLAVGEKSILIAEVSGGTGGFAVTTPDHPEASKPFEATHLAEFVFPTGMTLVDAEQLGAALFQFLKEAGISVRHAVIGIPAKWVVVKSKQTPPAEPPVIAESLRLQAEGDFSAALSDLVYDYAGHTSLTESRQVLLMATPKRYIDQVLAVAKRCADRGAVRDPLGRFARLGDQPHFPRRPGSLAVRIGR